MFLLLRSLLRPWLVVLAGCLVYLGVILVLHQGDPLAFAVLGSRYRQGDPEGSEGYDGQFAYAIAMDPVGALDRMDEPAYRYQRILYPMVARWLALGRVDWIPWSLVFVNLAALVLGTVVMERLLVCYGVGPWFALVYGFYAGLMMSVRLDLNEPLSYGLVLAGVWAHEEGRPGWSALSFSLAALAKETALLFAAAYVVSLLLDKQARKALLFGMVVVGPFAIWQVVLWAWLGAPGVGSGGAMATPFEIVPLMGLWRIGLVSPAALWLYGVVLGPLVVVPTLWALVAAGRAMVRRDWHPLTLALFLNAAAVLFLPHSTWREFLAMLRLSIGLVTAVLLYAARRRDGRALRFSLAWLATLAFLAKETPPS